MATKILKRKRLFEDDFQNNQASQQQQPQQQQVQQQVQQPQQQAQQNQQVPQNTQVQNQNQQQPQQQQQQQQQPPVQPQLTQQEMQKYQEIQQKVGEILKNLENVYWAIGNDVPAEIQKAIPDFKQENQQAQPIIKLWNDFKAKPEQNTYNAFVNAFKTFGQVPQQQQQQINAGYKAEISFKQALHENLKKKNFNNMVFQHMSYYDE